MYVCQPTYFLPLNCPHHWYHDSPVEEIMTAKREVQKERR